MERPMDVGEGRGTEVNRKIELLLLFWKKGGGDSLKKKTGLYFKRTLQLLLLSKNVYSLGRKVPNKETGAETGTYPTSGRGSSEQPNLPGRNPPGGIGRRHRGVVSHADVENHST